MPKKKKFSVSWYKFKLKTLFSKIIRSKGYCERCRATDKTLQCSHIKSVGAYPNLQFDLENALSLCHRCHIYWWHKEPLEAAEWFKKKFPAKYKYLEKAKTKARGYKLTDYIDLFNEYTKRAEDTLENNSLI